LVDCASNTAIRFRFNSLVRACLPPAWVKQSRNPVRLSISISSDTIGANGSISVSSAFNAVASDGMSSAVNGEITRSPSSSRRTGPSPAPSVASSSPSAVCSSPSTSAKPVVASGGLPTSRQNSAR
jgi:hypothetical protein